MRLRSCSGWDPILQRHAEATLLTPRSPGFRQATAPVLLAASIYACAWLFLPHSGLFINDNGCKLIQTEGLVRDGGAGFSVPWPGRALDPALAFRPLGDPFGKVIDGRLFVSFPIPFALVTSLPYRLLGAGGLTLLPFLAGLLLLPAVAALARLLGADARGTWLAVLGTALGTPIWFYAFTLWEHLPAVCLLSWGLVLLLRGRTAMAAVLCGAAVWMRDDALLFALAMTLVPIVIRGSGAPGADGRPGDGRRGDGRGAAARFLSILLLTLVPLGAAQWLILGTPFGIHATAHGPLDQGVGQYLVERWTVFRDLVIDSHGTEWVSIVGGIPYVLLLLLHPTLGRRRFAHASEALLAWAAGWGAVALAGHLSSPAPIWYLPSANGLFAVSPLLILSCLREENAAAVSGPTAARGRFTTADRVRTALWLVAIIDLSLYVVAAPPLHVAGIHWGSRLLLPLFPVLGALAGTGAGRLVALRAGAARARAVVLIVAALGLSIAFQVHGLRLLRAEERFETRLNDEVMRRPEPVIVATSWVIPQELARCFYDKPIFLARTPADLGRVLTMLRARGVTRVLRIDASPATSGEPVVAGAPPSEPPGGVPFTDDLAFMSYRLSDVDLP